MTEGFVMDLLLVPLLLLFFGFAGSLVVLGLALWANNTSASFLAGGIVLFSFGFIGILWTIQSEMDSWGLTRGAGLSWWYLVPMVFGATLLLFALSYKAESLVGEIHNKKTMIVDGRNQQGVDGESGVESEPDPNPLP